MDIEVLVLELALITSFEGVELLSHVFFKAKLDVSHFRKLFVVF